MTKEWYEYAISIKKQTKNKLKKISDIGTCIVLVFFSLPLLISNIWCWLILCTLYSLSLFHNSREKDEYSKALFDIGSLLFVIGIEVFATVSIFSDSEKFFLTFTILGFILYEITVFIKVKSKKYSTHTKELKQTSFGYLFAWSGIVIGSTLGGALISNDNISLLMILIAVVAGMFVVFSITLLQRYFIYKIISKSNKSNN